MISNGGGEPPPERKIMDEKEKVLTVPYIVYEGAMARAERRERRLIKALITAIVAAVLIAAGFLLYLNQYDIESYIQDGTGVNVMGNMLGSMNGGEYKNGTEEGSP